MALFPIVCVVVYLGCAAGWVWLFQRRLEPWLRGQMGRWLGFPISRRMQGRSYGWYGPREASAGYGCILLASQMAVDMGVGGLPLFLGLLVMGLALFSVYGGS